MASSTKNFHIPLTTEMHDQLRQFAKERGQPASHLAREALQEWLAVQEAKRLQEEISRFARENAGTELDLDEDLERAGIGVVLREEG